MTLILLIVGIVLIILEAITTSTFLIWIGFGFICASIVSLLTESIFIILVVGIIGSIISVALFKKEYVKIVKEGGNIPTSYNENIGKKATMITDYKSDGVATGRAIVNGMEWSVQAKGNDLSFSKGELVYIKKIEGVRLIIEKEK